MVNQNFEDLILKIDGFIRKYYLNKILRGSILIASILLISYLLIFLSFYFFTPSPIIKTIIFYTYVISSLTIILFYFIRPLLSYLKLGKQISMEEASSLIGKHFNQVNDKLINILQLNKLAEENRLNKQLIIASIEQKSLELKPFPFFDAIRIADNKKYIHYFVIPLIIIASIALTAPSILKVGTQSFIKYDEIITAPAPFQFNVLNKSLEFTQGQDVMVEIKLTGNQFPQDIYVIDGTNTFKIQKNSINEFYFKIKNIQNDKKVILKGGGFFSKPIILKVNHKAEVISIDAQLIYPKYLNKIPLYISNVTDITIPEGTLIKWIFSTKNAREIQFEIQNKKRTIKVENDKTTISTQLKKSAKYTVIANNPKNTDSIERYINVINDKYPTINFEEKTDQLNSNIIYFNGEILDDYGFKDLMFIFNIKENDKIIKSYKSNINIKTNLIANNFIHYIDFKEVPIQDNHAIEYYFIVKDNDANNGFKATRSTVNNFRKLNKKEETELFNSNSTLLKEKINKARELAQNIEKDSKRITEKLVDKKQISFEDQKEIEKVLNNQLELEELVNELKTINENNNQKNNDLFEKQELIDKQKQIENLFNNVLDEKTKQLLEKLQQLLNKRNKDQTKDELSKLQMDNKTVNNELDRILELYKQLEYEQNLQLNLDRLNNLSKDQKDILKKTTEKDQNLESLKKLQDNLNLNFNDLKEDFKELENKNQKLERPNTSLKFEEEFKSISDELRNGKEELDKNQRKKAADNQKSAADQMDQLAQKIEEQQQEQESIEQNVNAKELRQLIENLLKISFQQEDILITIKRLHSSDPLYTSAVQKQRSIKDNIKTIADSLFSLSKRVPQLESSVNEEINKVNFNIEKSLEHLSERRTSEANRFQQSTLTAINNLSLILSEGLNQLRNQSKNSKSNNKRSLNQLTKMQEDLNKQMDKAKQELEKTGNSGEVPKGQLSEEFAKMAQQQQLIRQALEELNREQNKGGGQKLGNLNELVEDMKKTESDLVNKTLQQEVINRQKDLLTKLLNAEKALREQDEKEERESKSAKQFPPEFLKMVEEAKSNKNIENGYLQKIAPTLNYFYKNKTIEYLKTFDVIK